MKQIIKYYIFFVFLLSYPLKGTSLVYNLKIRRAFDPRGFIKRENKSLTFVSAVPIVYTKNRHITNALTDINIQEKRIISGSLFNVRYIPNKQWWIELATGFENEQVNSKGTLAFKGSRTGFDDLIAAGGYNIYMGKQNQLVIYGLGGIPLHRKITDLEAYDTLVGTRFYSLGAGAEFSHNFIGTKEKSLICFIQSRFLHFFNRSGSPILPSGAIIQPGNVIDILGAVLYRKNRNFLEVGYNPTFFTNQAIIVNNNTISSPSFVRHGFFSTLTHKCKRIHIGSAPLIIGAGFLISRSSQFDTKIGAAWLNISTVF